MTKLKKNAAAIAIKHKYTVREDNLLAFINNGNGIVY